MDGAQAGTITKIPPITRKAGTASMVHTVKSIKDIITGRNDEGVRRCLKAIIKAGFYDKSKVVARGECSGCLYKITLDTFLSLQVPILRLNPRRGSLENFNAVPTRTPWTTIVWRTIAFAN